MLAPLRVEAEELRGVAFDSMLVSLDGSKATQLLWNDCSGATSDEQAIECEVGSISARAGSAPACLTIEASPPPASRMFAWSSDYRLVRQIISEAPLIGANNERGCYLETEGVYRGLYTVAFEHSAFWTAPGEIWWLHLENGLSEVELESALGTRMKYICLEARGVALPPRQDGHGHMGAYTRGFFVTEVVRTFAPDERVLALDQRTFDDIDSEVHRVCNWNTRG